MQAAMPRCDNRAVHRHERRPMIPACRSLVATLVLAMTQIPSARAADGGPLTLRPGDSWTFRLTLSQEGRPEVIAHPRYSVARQAPAGRWIIAEGSVDEVPGTIQLMKGYIEDSRCMVDVAGTRTLQPLPCTAAARVDDHWTVELEDGRTRDARVLGTETVRVPAGSFESLRLEVVEQPGAGAARTEGADTRTDRALLWYAPALGVVVRAERDVLRAGGLLRTHTVEVLESTSRGNAGSVHTNRLLPPDHHGSHAPRLMMTPDCQPKYPPEAVRAKATGKTRVRLAIDAEGHFRNSELIGASGRTAEHRLLDDAVKDSIARCRFKPATSASGDPEAATVDVQYQWRIE